MFGVLSAADLSCPPSLNPSNEVDGAVALSDGVTLSSPERLNPENGFEELV